MRPFLTKEKTMRNIAVLCGLAVSFSMGVELPICEEFANEENITCVTGEHNAVITALHTDGTKTMEFFKDSKKAYMELGTDGHLYASSGKRAISVQIPVEGDAEVDTYIYEVLTALMDDIAFAD